MPPENQMPQPVTDILPEDVGKVVQRFIDFDDVENLTVEIQGDGNFTVRPGLGGGG